MSRLSLIRQWTYFGTVIYFLSPEIVFYFMHWNKPLPLGYWAGMAATLASGALVLTVYYNRVCLPWTLRGWIFVRAGLIYLLYFYCAIALMTGFDLWWEAKVAEQASLIYGMPLIVAIYFSPIALPIYLIAMTTNAIVARALYDKRDYLPGEEV